MENYFLRFYQFVYTPAILSHCKLFPIWLKMKIGENSFSNAFQCSKFTDA